MVGFQVGFCSFFMTGPTLGCDFVHEFILLHRGDHMCSVALNTGGELLLRELGGVGMIALQVGFVDPFVAISTGLLHIGGVNR